VNLLKFDIKYDRDVCAILAAAASGTGIPYLMGFKAGGIAAGSGAAAIQSGIRNVAAGSVFSILQSLGATTVLGTGGAVALWPAAWAYYYMYC
jgi:hypothetical protein